MRCIPFKIVFVKKIDSLFGPFFIKWMSKVSLLDRVPLSGPRSILVIRPGGIGDAVLLIPAIIALKREYPNALIDILAEKRNSAVFSLSPQVNDILHYDKMKELRMAIRRDYDVVIDTEQWHRLSAVVARLTRAPMLLGFATNERMGLFTHAISYSHDDYEVDSFLNLIKPLKCVVAYDTDKPFLVIPDCYQEAIKSQLQAVSGTKIIALFPGSSINERKWGSDRFHQVAKLLSEQGYSIVVVGGKEDTMAGEEITQGLPNCLNVCGKLSLPETAAVLKESSLLITGDSGIMHIGYGLGVKIVALFGPGREKKWAPRGRDCKIINRNFPCSPCTSFGYTPKCRKNAECMQSITANEVFNEAMSLLNEKNT